MTVVNDEQIRNALRQCNPWWRSPAAAGEAAKPQMRTACCEAVKILEHKTIRRFAILSGARGTGKSTILFQIIGHMIAAGVSPQNILYASFDNPLIRLAGAAGILSAYDLLFPGEGTRYLFFDEIQYADGWEQWMTSVYDSRREIRLAAAISACPIPERELAGNGAGRWRILRVASLSFFEYCSLLRLREPSLSENLRLTRLSDMDRAGLNSLTEQFLPLQEHFIRYLTAGGLPEPALSGDDFHRRSILSDDRADRIIRRDIPFLFSIRNPLLMEKLFLYLCVNAGGVFNATAAAKELGSTSVSTIESYTEMFEMANLIYLLRPTKVGSRGSLKDGPKIFIADPAIQNAALMSGEIPSGESELSAALKAAVYRHIVSFYQGSPAQIGYYRKAGEGRKEVDIVVELPREKILFEVKFRGNSGPDSSDAIAALCIDKPAGITGAFLVTAKPEDFGVANPDTAVPILRIPAAAFLYLLGKAEAEGRSGKL